MTTTRDHLRELLEIARACGESSDDLGDGLSVLVRVRETRHQVVFRRAGAPIGLVEAISLRVAAGVPDCAGAVRYPATDAGVHRLSLTWDVEATIFDLPVQPPPPPPPRARATKSHVWQLLAEGEPLPGSLR